MSVARLRILLGEPTAPNRQGHRIGRIDEGRMTHKAEIERALVTLVREHGMDLVKSIWRRIQTRHERQLSEAKDDASESLRAATERRREHLKAGMTGDGHE